MTLGEKEVTPWGSLQDLRSHRLRPGPGKDPHRVARNQRERMFAAMVAVCARRGYAATRVADVIEVAGVSRSTFYSHFESLHACFLATLDALLEATEAAMADVLDRQAPWDERLRSYYQALVDAVVAQPAAARMCLIEAYVVGPDAVDRVDRMARAAGRRALAVLEESPERAGMPREVARGVLGGLRTMVQTRLYAGREQELPALVPQLMDWALGYRTPPTALRAEPAAAAPLVMPSRDPDAPRQRIIDSLIATTARKGRRGTTITEIASGAAISLTTFYKRFEGKDEAFLAAFDDVMLRLFEVALPAYREAGDWPKGVRDAIDASFAYMAEDPLVARFAADVVWSGGPAAITRLEESMAGFHALLAKGLRRRSGPQGPTAEAIAASILALGYDSVARGRAERLRELTAPAAFVALAPAIGSIEACTVANGD